MVASKSQDRSQLFLRNGDRMMGDEFHAAYCKMPESYRAELLGGIVFEPSPLGYSHGEIHVRLAALFDLYCESTPGCGAADNATVILSKDDEVQPDLVLRIDQDYGGRSRINRSGYLKGAPELVAEVAFSSRAIDLHLKKDRYALAGVNEYLVLCLAPLELYWFDLGRTKSKLRPSEEGIFKSAVFPGLWIHGDALLTHNRKLASDTLKKGLKSQEHRDFVRNLKRQKKRQ